MKKWQNIMFLSLAVNCFAISIKSSDSLNLYSPRPSTANDTISRAQRLPFGEEDPFYVRFQLPERQYSDSTDDGDLESVRIRYEQLAENSPVELLEALDALAQAILDGDYDRLAKALEQKFYVDPNSSLKDITMLTRALLQDYSAETIGDLFKKLANKDNRDEIIDKIFIDAQGATPEVKKLMPVRDLSSESLWSDLEGVDLNASVLYENKN